MTTRCFFFLDSSLNLSFNVNKICCSKSLNFRALIKKLRFSLLCVTFIYSLVNTTLKMILATSVCVNSRVKDFAFNFV